MHGFLGPSNENNYVISMVILTHHLNYKIKSLTDSEEGYTWIRNLDTSDFENVLQIRTKERSGKIAKLHFSLNCIQ